MKTLLKIIVTAALTILLLMNTSCGDKYDKYDHFHASYVEIDKKTFTVVNDSIAIINIDSTYLIKRKTLDGDANYWVLKYIE